MADDHETIADKTLTVAKEVGGGAVVGTIGGIFLSEYAMLGLFARTSKILLGGALFGAVAVPILAMLIRHDERRKAIEESKRIRPDGAAADPEKTWMEREADKKAVNALPPKSFS